LMVGSTLQVKNLRKFGISRWFLEDHKKILCPARVTIVQIVTLTLNRFNYIQQPESRNANQRMLLPFEYFRFFVDKR
jgi:hypothetical protein